MSRAGRAPWRTRTAGMPFFAASRGSRRERSGSDVVQLVGSVLVGTVLAVLAVPPSSFEQALVELFAEVPPTLDLVWRFGAGSLALWVLVVVVAAAVRRRGDVLVDLVATALLATAVAVLMARALEGSWPSFDQAVGGHTSDPLVALALGSGAALAASPHLSPPFRRFGRWCVAAATLSAVLLGATTPIGALLSLVLAGAAAAAVHLVLGSRAGAPTATEVAGALADLGVQATDLAVTERLPGGQLVVAATAAGRPVVVKVLGRDSRDTQLLSRLWRWLWLRDAAPPTWSRQQLAEHEGFVTLLAARREVPVPDVVMAGSTGSRDALVVLEGGGRPVATARTGDTDRLGEIWDAVQALHAADMAHGAIDPTTFAVLDGRVVLSDLSTATTAPSEDQRRIDQAQTLVTTAVMTGIERAVTVAAQRLGDDATEAMLPYLQLPAMSHRLRRLVHDAPFDLDALRSATAGVIGVEVPEVVELRRVSPRTLVTAALIVLVAFALITALTDVDPAEVAEVLNSADPGWLLFTLVAAQVPFLSQAVATRGACPRRVSYGPVLMLQISIGFIALAVPTTAGRLALDVRFFQRQGVPPASAVSISAIDGFAGFLVQVSLLVLTLVFGVGSVELDFGTGSGADLSGLVTVLAVAAAVLVLAAVLAVALPRVRRRLLERVRPLLSDVRDTVQGLRSLSHALQLVGGNLANQLLFAAVLGAALVSFGGRLDLATLVVIYVVAALFGGFMPVPGGIGAVEAALIAGLVAAGIDKSTATATALTFRFATFYLPPLWGWIAMRWLQRHSYL